jgi:hypothetical protein
MNSVRTIFKLIGAIWLIAVLAIGFGGAWLQHNPEAAGAYALGAMNVDPQANPLRQAGQMAEGVSMAREGLAAMRGLERSRAALDRTADKRRKYRELREEGWGHEAALRSAGLPVVQDGPE